MTPTHYTILSIPPSLPPTHKNYQTLLKKSYHRTLLRCHPDKLPADAIPATVDGHQRDGIEAGEDIYTVDQINTAYRTLSSPSLRREYDLSLQSRPRGNGTDGGYKAGLDVLDLDDMVYHPSTDDSGEETGGKFTKPCRCGAEEGYVLTEEDMDEAEKEVDHSQSGGNMARSMVIGCLGCSLWVQVDWVVCDDEDEGGEKE